MVVLRPTFEKIIFPITYYGPFKYYSNKLHYNIIL